MADNEDLDLDFEDALDDEGDSGSDGADDNDGTEGAPPDDDNSESDEPESKRVNDLMSNWQKEQARANRLQAELDALKAPKSKGRAKATAAPEENEFVQFAREQTRNTLYASDPRLAQYGIDVTAITGSTPAEMQASLNGHRKMIDSLESRIRNDVLREHGLAPDVVSDGTRERRTRGFDPNMSDADFEKLLEKRSSF